MVIYNTFLVAGGFTSEGDCEVFGKSCASSRRGIVSDRGQGPESESDEGGKNKSFIGVTHEKTISTPQLMGRRVER